jgi:hypothetical protein
MYGAGVGHGLTWDTSPHPGAMNRAATPSSPHPGAMMRFHNQNREYRPVTAALACHPEPMRYAQGQLREGSGGSGDPSLRSG